MKKILLIIIVGIFFFSLVSAQSFLGTFEEGVTIELTQICSNDTALCDGCNISSIKHQNSSSIISNVEMTKRTADFNYTLDGSYTSNVLGTYSVKGFCWTASETQVWSYTFDVTKSGKEFTQEQAILYLVVVGVLIFIFLLFLCGAITIPFRNLRNDEEIIIGLNHLKYLKLFCIYISYLLFVWIMNLLVGLTNYYLDLGLALSMFAFIFRFLSRTLFPVFILTFAYAFILFIKDKNMKKLIDRGIKLR